VGRCQEWNQGDDCVSFCGATWLVIIQRSQVFKGIAYLIPAPVEGLSGPRQYPFASATGTSSRKYSCMFNCPSIILTSTMIPRDALSSDHHYHPGFVGGPGSGSSGRSGCFLSEGGLMSFNGNASCMRLAQGCRSDWCVSVSASSRDEQSTQLQRLAPVVWGRSSLAVGV